MNYSVVKNSIANNYSDNLNKQLNMGIHNSLNYTDFEYRGNTANIYC